MKKSYNRREFARNAALAGAVTFGFQRFPGITAGSSKSGNNDTKGHLKLSLNAFSFDKPLRAGTMSLDDLLDFCAKTGFDGVDLTGYYFPGYPAVPTMNIFIT